MNRLRRHVRRGSAWASTASLIAGLASALALAGPATADEPIFGFVNTTDLLPKGKTQIEAWLSVRESEALGDVRSLEGRTELDYGLTNSVQVTLYLNFSDLNARIDPAQAAALGLSPAGRVERSRFDGATGEVIWRITSPYLDPLGFAVLADASFGPGQRVVGFKAIGQKNFRDDTVVLAANLRVDLGQREARRSEVTGLVARRHVTALEASLGASWRFRANWSAALEMRARRTSAGGLLEGGPHEASAVFVGPTVHYGGERWFLTLSALKRVSGGGEPRHGLADSLVHARDRARWDAARLRVGRTF